MGWNVKEKQTSFGKYMRKAVLAYDCTIRAVANILSPHRGLFLYTSWSTQQQPVQ